MQILHITSPKGGRPTTVFYNLDVVISVDYRVKSFEGTRFRQWATRALRNMLLQRLSDMRRIDKLESRMDKAELNIKQIQGGVNYLAKLIRGKTVRVEWVKKDQYGRVLGIVYATVPPSCTVPPALSPAGVGKRAGESAPAAPRIAPPSELASLGGYESSGGTVKPIDVYPLPLFG